MPPPPTMHGGGDYWAGNTLNSEGDVIFGNWWVGELGIALWGLNLPGFEIGYVGFDDVLNAIEDGYIVDLSFAEWFTIFVNANNPDKLETACRVAFKKGNEQVKEYALSRGCSPQVPIPKELLFLSILSFLLVFYFHNREELSSPRLSKNK
jgi:hypothetical protein